MKEGCQKEHWIQLTEYRLMFISWDTIPNINITVPGKHRAIAITLLKLYFPIKIGKFTVFNIVSTYWCFLGNCSFSLMLHK